MTHAEWHPVACGKLTEVAFGRSIEAGVLFEGPELALSIVRHSGSLPGGSRPEVLWARRGSGRTRVPGGSESVDVQADPESITRHG